MHLFNLIIPLCLCSCKEHYDSILLWGDQYHYKEHIGYSGAEVCNVLCWSWWIRNFSAHSLWQLCCILFQQLPRFNESLMATLLYLLNSPESRLYMRSDVGLEVCLFGCFIFYCLCHFHVHFHYYLNHNVYYYYYNYCYNYYHIYSNQRPTSNQCPPRITARPKGRKS